MPIYEYNCQQCGHQLEAMQKISDTPLQDCPECQRPTLKKMISAVAFRFKGGGWYETDFKTGDKKNLADGGNEKPKGDGSDSKSGGPEGAKPGAEKTAGGGDGGSAEKSASSEKKSAKTASPDSKPGGSGGSNKAA